MRAMRAASHQAKEYRLSYTPSKTAGQSGQLPSLCLKFRQKKEAFKP